MESQNSMNIIPLIRQLTDDKYKNAIGILIEEKIILEDFQQEICIHYGSERKYKFLMVFENDFLYALTFEEEELVDKRKLNYKEYDYKVKKTKEGFTYIQKYH
jgi:hypothetical protein